MVLLPFGIMKAPPIVSVIFKTTFIIGILTIAHIQSIPEYQTNNISTVPMSQLIKGKGKSRKRGKLESQRRCLFVEFLADGLYTD